MTASEAIARAHQALDASAQRAAACPWRPIYHFAAPAGWINDPNGLIRFRDEYHLFYQHYPYAPKWGPMHWGHAASADLVHWRHLPIALAPTEPYELSAQGGGCFSGSALENDGRLVLMYTGDSASHTPRETQNIAVSDDGLTFTKHLANPVIREFPAEGSADFRDPRIWRHGEWFYAIIGTGQGGIGKVVLYRSRDLASWDYLGVCAQSDGRQGSIWECPDLFEVDGRHVLIFSPTGLGRPLTMCMVGRLDYGTHRFTAASCSLLDHGSDFYAPQTMFAADGRRIMIGWMQAWGAEIPTEKNGWSGAMSLPRELRLRNDQLLQFPAREIESLRGSETRFDQAVSPGVPCRLPLQADAAELHVTIGANRQCSAAGVRVRCSADGSQFTEIRWDREARQLTLDRSRAGEGAQDRRSAPYSGDALEIRIFVDRSSVEVFSADGAIALTSRVYPDPESRGIEVFTEGQAARIECIAWELRA